jgi:hypothetical protein
MAHAALGACFLVVGARTASACMVARGRTAQGPTSRGLGPVTRLDSNLPADVRSSAWGTDPGGVASCLSG